MPSAPPAQLGNPRVRPAAVGAICQPLIEQLTRRLVLACALQGIDQGPLGRIALGVAAAKQRQSQSHNPVGVSFTQSRGHRKSV